MVTVNFLFEHPHGAIGGWFSTRGLQRLTLTGPGARRTRFNLLHSAANDQRFWVLHNALKQYFAGVVEHFAGIPIDLDGGTPFQRSVWQATRKIPWGETLTYGELARRVKGSPNAARAVGQAMNRNPIPIVIPCHRVVAVGGQLGGFGAGLPWKRLLLRTEGHDV